MSYKKVFGSAMLMSIAVPVAALAQEAAEPVKNLPETGDGIGGAALQVAAVLFLMIAFLYFGFWALKRFGPSGGFGTMGKSDMKVEGQLPLGPKKSVMVVRILDKRLVLGVTDSSINMLTELDDANDDTEKDFQTALDSASQDGGAP